MNATPKPDSAMYLPGPQVEHRYNRTGMTIHRWLSDPAMDFPRPFYFGRYRYWKISDLEDWEARQAAKPAGRFCRAESEVA